MEALLEIAKTSGDIRDVADMHIEVKDESNRFPLLIDGKQFGPFQRIKIYPFTINSQPVTLPIKTFLPIASN